MLITKLDRITKTTEAKNETPPLEREVIFSTVILYLLICGALIAVHYLQPSGQETVTSSSSPSHQEFSTSAGK
jgi:hypothetical protein